MHYIIISLHFDLFMLGPLDTVCHYPSIHNYKRKSSHSHCQSSNNHIAHHAPPPSQRISMVMGKASALLYIYLYIVNLLYLAFRILIHTIFAYFYLRQNTAWGPSLVTQLLICFCTTKPPRDRWRDKAKVDLPRPLNSILWDSTYVQYILTYFMDDRQLAIHGKPFVDRSNEIPHW